MSAYVLKFNYNMLVGVFVSLFLFAIMPYVSKDQLRYFFAAESQGKLPKGTALRWAHETPNLKSLPDKKNEKTAGMFDTVKGIASDTSNALWGKDGLGRLQSWNRVKGYLPSGVSNHIDNKHVNPRIFKYLKDNAWQGLGLAGSGLLGAYWLYSGLTRPKKQNQPNMPDNRLYMAPSLTSTRSVNENLGYDIFGRARK